MSSKSCFSVDKLIDYDDGKYEPDQWKLYLFELFQDNLKERLNEMISLDENKLFYKGIKYEYGYGVNKNLDKALALYIKSSGANSTNYLSMARLFCIHKYENKFKIKKDKNLELIYLFKSFVYLPFYIFDDKSSNTKFTLDFKYLVAKFLDNNDPNIKYIDKYFDELQLRQEYKDIISDIDCNLIKGFVKGYFYYNDKTKIYSLDELISLSIMEVPEALYRLVIIYYSQLEDKEFKKNEEEIKSKIYDLYLKLEEKKYYRAYADYGEFLFNEIGIYDKALEIFKEGYEHNNFECSFLYFNVFIKQCDYDNLDSDKSINILQTLVDSFIYGNYYSLRDIFDYVHIMNKRYNLNIQISNKYMKYLDEIATLCKLFVDKNNGESNTKKYINSFKNFKYFVYHSLSVIYMYSLTSKVKKNLIKAEKYIKLIIRECDELDKHVKPYYTRLLYKVRKKLFKMGVFEDENYLIKIGNLVFKLYKENEYYDRYGNSYYYLFGKLYEKGIGTPKNDKKAYEFYKRGCVNFFNIYDNFIIVYKRYLSLKKINLNKFNIFHKKVEVNIIKFNAKFHLSKGGNPINLQINNNMLISEIKDELYKKKELHNLYIKCLLFNGINLANNDTVGFHKIKENSAIIVVVENKNNNVFN